ncbi:hypothetical protein D3C87_2081260 [compost metagenome]
MVATGTHTTERRAASSAGQLLVPVDDAGTALQPEVLVARMGVGQQTGSKAILGVVGFSNRCIKVAVANDLQ